ncbi:DUF2470 domain-containing protein [Streptomyces boninensis]|uniref:DUF2470 domain-containing protein n=1 Tax=Streptomyces boninensis TaxID=2039455 RepID=UPI003B21162B
MSAVEFTGITTKSAKPAKEPTPAERIRTILATSDSLALTLLDDGYRADLVGLHSADEYGALTLRPPRDSALATRVAGAELGDLPAQLELTDLAPVAVRDRVRAQVTLAGWLTADPGRPAADHPDANRLTLRFDCAQATLTTPFGSRTTDMDELALAAPDPLAPDEARYLLHLADSHSEAVDQLTRLLPARRRRGVTRVRPLALDRYGLTLRTETPRTHLDTRLPFPKPLRKQSDLNAGMRALFSKVGVA